MHVIAALSWKRATIIAILVAELATLSFIAWSASSSPADGTVVRFDQAGIRVSDQTAVTTSLTIDWIVVPGPSWVVVRADYGTGAQGPMIGKAHVDAGESVNVEVALETTTLPHAAVATLISDRGEVGTFEYSGQMASGGMGGSTSLSTGADKPYVTDGAVLSFPFSITPLSFKVDAGQAWIGSATRSAKGASVTASDVVAPGRSWLSVSRETTSGAPGDVLGVAPVPPGRSSAISVPLQSVVGTRVPLVAMLHADIGHPSVFEYSIADIGNSSDQPYVAGGQTVKVVIPPAR